MDATPRPVAALSDVFTFKIACALEGTAVLVEPGKVYVWGRMLVPCSSATKDIGLFTPQEPHAKPCEGDPAGDTGGDTGDDTGDDTGGDTGDVDAPSHLPAQAHTVAGRVGAWGEVRDMPTPVAVPVMDMIVAEHKRNGFNASIDAKGPADVPDKPHDTCSETGGVTPETLLAADLRQKANLSLENIACGSECLVVYVRSVAGTGAD